jgi:hypothetical protein
MAWCSRNPCLLDRYPPVLHAPKLYLFARSLPSVPSKMTGVAVVVALKCVYTSSEWFGFQTILVRLPFRGMTVHRNTSVCLTFRTNLPLGPVQCILQYATCVNRQTLYETDVKMAFPSRPNKRGWRDDPPQCPPQPPQPQDPAYIYSPLATVTIYTAYRASPTTLTCTTGWSSSKLPTSSSQSPPGSFRFHFSN